MLSFRRAIALLLALLFLLTAGGVLSAAAAFETTCTSSCCPIEEAPTDDGSSPETDCQCSSCLVMEMIQPSAVGTLTTAELSWTPPAVTLPPSGFVRAIEYPPKG